MTCRGAISLRSLTSKLCHELVTHAILQIVISRSSSKQPGGVQRTLLARNLLELHRTRIRIVQLMTRSTDGCPALGAPRRFQSATTLREGNQLSNPLRINKGLLTS